MKKFQNITNKIAPVVSLGILFLIWLFVGEEKLVPAYMLPSPIDVAKVFVTDFSILLRHLLITVQEAAYGLLLGIALAFITATVMDRFAFVKKALYPMLVITQTIPTIALAPLLVLWMGYDMAPKIALVTITTFFPIAINLLDGFSGADEDAICLMKAMGATRRQIFFHLKLPSSIGNFFAGLRVSASYALVGALIAEWLGGTAGIGVYMTRVKKAYAFDKMFAVILLIIVLSLVLVFVVQLLQKAAMPWTHADKKQKKLGE